MAKKYFITYHDNINALRLLSDAERGRLYLALLEYSMKDEDYQGGNRQYENPKLSGNERFMFEVMKAQIDRENEKYKKICDRNKSNGTKGGRPKKSDTTEENKDFLIQENSHSKTQKTQSVIFEPKETHKNRNTNTNKNNNNNIKKEKEKKEKNAESVSPPSFNKQSEDILKLYNDNCTNLPKARQLSVKRHKQISLLFRRGYSLEDFQKVFENAQNSRFLCGENDRNWKANFDWLIIENNFLKALEGYYENFQTSSPPHKLEHKRSYNIEEYANYSIFDKVGESNYGNPNYHEYPEG